MGGVNWRNVLAAFGLAPRPLMTREEFRDRFIEAAQSANAAAEVRVTGVENVEITVPGEGTGTVYTGNAYGWYREEPERRDHFIGILVRGSVLGDPMPEASLENLVAVIRPAEYADDGLLSRPFAGELVAIVALDSPEAIGYPDWASLSSLAANEEAVWTAALANAERLRGDLEVTSTHDGLVIVNSAQGVASSMLLDGSLEGIDEVVALGPRPAVMIGKSNLALCDSEDVEALKALQVLWSDLPHEWVTDSIFARDGASWAELTSR